MSVATHRHLRKKISASLYLSFKRVVAYTGKVLEISVGPVFMYLGLELPPSVEQDLILRGIYGYGVKSLFLPVPRAGLVVSPASDGLHPGYLCLNVRKLGLRICH